MSPRGAVLIGSLAVLFAILYWIPVGYGVMTGMRSMQYRYLYGFGLPIAVLTALPILILFRRSAFLECTAVFLAFSYFAFLECYALNENWRYRKAYDEKVWAAVDAQIADGYTHLLLVDTAKPLAATVSDFSQPWGIQVYLWAHSRGPITFDMDTVAPKNLGKKMAVIRAECPTPHHFLNPLITVYPSYESYRRQQGAQ